MAALGVMLPVGGVLTIDVGPGAGIVNTMAVMAGQWLLGVAVLLAVGALLWSLTRKRVPVGR